MAIGFLDGNPQLYNINKKTFFSKTNDVQPHRSQNYKIAMYMADGQRLYSYDYLEGVGIWPGPNNKLVYKEDYLLYGLNANRDGTQIIGYVWERVKIISLRVKCADNRYQ
eukprot:GHVR01116821.1.p1 GENE.GHVR01116821.1~~GHVR01116821.1.p1  ORF type:complete len:110 (+),score=7.23 GHVR01116821.1:736-1065(+)